MRKDKFSNDETLLSTWEVAKRLDFKKYDDVYSMIKNGKFPNAFKIGKEWRIPTKDMEIHELNSNKTKGCLDVKHTGIRLGYEKHKILSLLKKHRFPNAFKHLHKWWIPESDIIFIENERLNTLDVLQLRDKFNLYSANYVTYLINRGEFPNAYKDHSGKWRIPYKDIEIFSKKSDDSSLSTKDTSTLLNKPVREINRLIQDNIFHNAYRFNGKWKIPLRDINKYDEINSEHLNIEQAMLLLNYKSKHSIFTLIEKSLLPNASKFRGEWKIPLEDIESIRKTLTSSLNTMQTAKKLQLSSSQIVYEMIRKGIFPNAFKDPLSKWRIPLEDIEKYEVQINIENHVDLAKAANILKYKSVSAIKHHLKKGRLPRSFKHQGKWWVHKDDLNNIKIDKNNNTNKKTSTSKTEPPKLNGFMNVKDIQIMLKIDKTEITSLIRKEILLNALKYNGKWWVPKSSVENYLSEQERVNELKQNTLSVEEAAKRLGYAAVGSMSNLINKEKRFPNAFKIGVHWRIPEEDIKAFEKRSVKKNKKVNFSPLVAFTELREFINTIEITDNFRETKTLFIQYSLLQINSMSGSNTYRRGRVLLYKRFYKKIVNEFNNEIFLVSMTEIEEMLHKNSPFKKIEKKVLIPFLRYVYSQKDMDPDLEFSLLSNNKQTSDQDIYSPELFHEIYQYVKMTQEHMHNAIKNRYYANMWVYNILLLTDFIRGQDLIMNTPSIDLEALNITSFDSFIENGLSNRESQSIINQLYLHFRNKRASKTDELLTFLVAPDLVEPLAHALVISELHRDTETNELLLGTFLEGRYSKVKTQGKMRHKNFFQQLKTTSEFQFSSLKMNRTVATYLFYSITEEDGQDSDLALHLSQVSRSHKKSDSTSRYIQSTNKDGSINRVSYNLFRRGHFGWLYNYLLLYVSQFKNTQDTLEERSNLIESTREETTPNELENMAEFVHNNLIPIDLKDHSNDMEAFMQNIYNKKQSVISKLKNYSKEEIHDIITNLAKGNLPSKNEGAQCLVYPECKKPMLSNCFSCEYVIPGNLMLIQLNEELKRLINNLKDLTNEVIMKRESMFLMHALLIWKEARIAFGEDKVNAYIPKKETWQEIESIAGKLSIE